MLVRAIACAVALTVAMSGPKASGEAANTTPSKTLPSYIEADRSDADQVLGPALTDEVFSDRFTAPGAEFINPAFRRIFRLPQELRTRSHQQAARRIIRLGLE